MLLRTASFWIFFTISYALDTTFVMNIPLCISWHFSFDPPSLYIDFIAACLHCNGICVWSTTLLNIIVTLSIISFLLLLTILLFMLIYLDLLVIFILRITFFTFNCVVSFFSTLGSYMIFRTFISCSVFSSCRFSDGLACSKILQYFWYTFSFFFYFFPSLFIIKCEVLSFFSLSALPPIFFCQYWYYCFLILLFIYFSYLELLLFYLLCVPSKSLYFRIFFTRICFISYCYL